MVPKSRQPEAAQAYLTIQYPACQIELTSAQGAITITITITITDSTASSPTFSFEHFTVCKSGSGTTAQTRFFLRG
jgi:hypothetical protein